MDRHSWDKMWDMGKLNSKIIRDLTAPGRYGDGDGLYLFIRQGGSRQWMLRIVVRGRRCDIGLGSVTTMTLAEAREAAHAMRKAAKQGGDPIQERRKGNSTPTYREAAELVWKKHRPSWKNAKHADQWINTQKTYVFPVIGNIRVDLITSSNVLDVLSPIWLKKEETARRVKQRMGTVFDWAKASGYRNGDDPLAGISRALPRQSRDVKHHDAMHWSQVPGFMRQLREREDDAMSAKALQFLILTVLRSSEVRLAKWDEIDWKASIWRVPAARMKMRQQHSVPLAPEAVTLLKGCKDNGSEFIFPSDKPGRALSDAAFSALIERMKLEGFTPHGFRSTFRDWCSENDAAPREVAEMALAHRIGNKTELAYARSDLLERRRELMTKWAKYVLSS